MGVQKMPPNTAKVFNLTSLEQTKEFEIVQFNLDQYKDNFDDWNDAFHRSVMKRVSHSSQKIFIGLSSGYDSGAICLELLKNKIPFKAYSVLGTENDSILEERFKLLEKAGIPYQRLTKDQENWFKAHIHILDNTEEFRYSVSSASSSYREDIKMIDDSGSNWLSWVCCHAQKDGRKIYLSGGGADEVFSDYGWNGEKKFAHSNFGGLFPENLSLIFPWNSFYGSTMEAYLAKEEYVAGSYGLEARYPYLDVNVVQEFLNLTNTLKNSVYKNVVDNYLTINNFPYCKGEKRGF
jgi:asparagine synthetase B (glutamine-hydrolysing)